MTIATSTVSDWSRRLVEALVSNGELDLGDARMILERAGNIGVPVATLLEQEGLVEARVSLECLSSLSGLRSIDLDREIPTREAATAVPLAIARRHRAVGHRLEDGYLVLACAEPLGAEQLRAIASSVDCGIAGCVLADPGLVERIVDQETLAAESESFPNEVHDAQLQPHIAPSQIVERATPEPSLTATDFAPTYATSELALADAEVSKRQSLEAEMLAPAAPLPVSEPLVSEAPPPAPPPPIPAPTPPPIAELTVSEIVSLASAMSAPDELDTPASISMPVSPDTGPLNAPAGNFTFGRGMESDRASGGAAQVDLDQLLVYAVNHGASDLHLASRFPPAVRIDGSIRTIEGLEPLDHQVLRQMIFSVLPQSVREKFEATKELDTSYELPGVGRFRVSVMLQRGAIGAVLRMIPPTIPSLDSLDLPPAISALADLRRGLVLVTGPTGSGKSTTLAGIVDKINASKPLHIITVEDPIEFQHEHKRSIVNQREVGRDTSSFGECLKHALRQDPDVILVGEMRDLETISTALTAAETGHLVFATLHTQDAPQTIDRIIDVFPTNAQDQIRTQLSGALEAVVTQQLVIGAAGVGRVPVTEIMVCTPGIRNLIRSAKTHQIYSLMQTGGASGMQTMDQALALAVKDRKISETVAFDRAHDPKQLLGYLKG